MSARPAASNNASATVIAPVNGGAFPQGRDGATVNAVTVPMFPQPAIRSRVVRPAHKCTGVATAGLATAFSAAREPTGGQRSVRARLHGRLSLQIVPGVATAFVTPTNRARIVRKTVVHVRTVAMEDAMGARPVRAVLATAVRASTAVTEGAMGARPVQLVLAIAGHAAEMVCAAPEKLAPIARAIVGTALLPARLARAIHSVPSVRSVVADSVTDFEVVTRTRQVRSATRSTDARVPRWRTTAFALPAASAD
jgi:hypothetical protein